jgi:single-stranded-DNA-specific exonuclease
MNKIWEINKKMPKAFLNKFPEYSRLTLQLLWDRGLKTQKAIDEFFNPDYNEDLHDPFLMKGMKKAVERTMEALKNKEKITIFGDYDADGVCGTAILSETLNVLGVNPDTYIPNRNKEGYGLNLKAVKEVAAKETNLIITIDCGITDFEEVKLANKLGMDVIIIDHHKVPDKVPSAVSIVNPCQEGERYPFKELAAAGVAFKVAQALLRGKVSEGWEKWLLDLAAIATVTDAMPLMGENRTLVKYGLVVLTQTKRLGLQELMKTARIKSTLDTYTLGYIIGPRLNAAGRMGHANTAYELLVTKSKEEAETLARRLDQKNQERQRLTDRIMQEVEGRIEPEKRKMIFEGDKNWPVGIVGLIAGRLTDKYYRPAIVFQKMKDESKGSARSIPSFNIVEAISECQNLLEDFGGHPGAAGFTVSNKNLKKFEQKLSKIAEEKIKKENLVSLLSIDLEIEPEELNFEAYEEIQRFAPFGEGNPGPLFLMKDLRVSNFRAVGNNYSHLKMYLTKELKEGRIKGFQAIGFGLGDFCDKIKQGDKIDAAFELITDDWNGARKLQLKIIDLKKSKL